MTADGEVSHCCCWELQAIGNEPVELSLLPDGFIDVIVTTGSRCQAITPSGTQDLPQAFLAGPLSGPLRVKLATDSRWFGLRMPVADSSCLGDELAAALRRSMRVPIPVATGSRCSSEIQDVCTDLLANPCANALQTQARLLNHFLSTNIDPLKLQAVSLARTSEGNATAGGIADRLGVHPRRLLRIFQSSVGTNPRTYCNLLRFRRAADRLRAKPGAELKSVALECGYADQAHLCRDFRRFAETSPARYVQSTLSPEASIRNCP